MRWKSLSHKVTTNSFSSPTGPFRNSSRRGSLPTHMFQANGSYTLGTVLFVTYPNIQILLLKAEL